MNKKGFTIIELMITFCMISAISFLLIELVLSLKELYIKGDMKTVLLTKQANMLKIINDDIDNKILTDLSICSDNTSCLQFTYTDGSTEKLIVNKEKEQLTYSNYSIKYGNNNKIGALSAIKTTIGDNEEMNTITTIIIPVENNLLKEEFNIEIIIQSNSNVINDNIINFT